MANKQTLSNLPAPNAASVIHSKVGEFLFMSRDASVKVNHNENTGEYSIQLQGTLMDGAQIRSRRASGSSDQDSYRKDSGDNTGQFTWIEG